MSQMELFSGHTGQQESATNKGSKTDVPCCSQKKGYILRKSHNLYSMRLGYTEIQMELNITLSKSQTQKNARVQVHSNDTHQPRKQTVQHQGNQERDHWKQALAATQVRYATLMCLFHSKQWLGGSQTLGLLKKKATGFTCADTSVGRWLILH